MSDIHHHAGQNFDFTFLSLNPYKRNSRILDIICHLFCHDRAGLCQNLSCGTVYHILSQFVACNTIAQQKLLIKFVTSHFCQIISSWIEEHAHNQALSALHCQRLAGTNFFVQL